MKLMLKVLAIILISTVLLSGVLTASTRRIDHQYLDGLYDLISSLYIGGLDKESVLGASLSGLFEGTSPYSSFEAAPRSSPSSMGIGAALEKVRYGFVVSAIHPGSPAFRAGLQPGDILWRANGRELSILSVADFSSLLADQGKGVLLEVLHPGTGTSREVTLDPVATAWVEVAYFIRRGIGFLRIFEYNENTAPQVARALEVFSMNRVQHVIVDLRDSISMNLEVAAQVADLMMPYGRIAQVKDRAFHASFKEIAFTFHLAVNRRTAGSGEMIAKAVANIGTGKVFGEETMGYALYVNSYPVLSERAYQRFAYESGRTDIIGILIYIKHHNIALAPEDIIGTLRIVESLVQDPLGVPIGENNKVVPHQETAETKLSYLDIPAENRIWIRQDYVLHDLSYDIYLAKVILRDLGYFRGEMNVTYDLEATYAVNQFKRGKGLPADGILDRETQKLLNVSMLAPLVFADGCIREILEQIEGK